MMKNFKKAISIFVLAVFILSIVPMGTFAEADEAGSTIHKLEFLNPVYVYKPESSVQNYGSYLYGSVPQKFLETHMYRAFFQLDFSGYEYLLRDPGTKINMSLTAGGQYSGDKLGAYNMYILPDSDDAYATNYKPYVSSTNGMKYNDVFDYVKGSVLTTNQDKFTPFVSRTDTTLLTVGTQIITSDANMQVLIGALDAATDDSTVTVQFMGVTGNAYIGLGSNTYLMLTPTTNPEATPAKYVSDTKSEIWGKLTSDDKNTLRSDLNLFNKYKGINIEWSSTNPTAVNPETGVVTRTREQQAATLTAALSYTDYSGKETIDTVSFDITLPALSLEEDPVFGDTVNDGTVELSKRSDNKPTYSAMQSVSGQLGGKAEGDAYLLYGDVGGNRIISLDNATGNQDTLEMSVYVPSGSKGMQLNVYVRKNTGTDYIEFVYTIEPDGIYRKYTATQAKIASLEPDRWYSLAFITPVAYDESLDENDTKMKLYVNGVLKNETELTASPMGYDPRFAPRLSTIGITSSAEPPAIYLDNIRIHSNPYAPQYDVEDKISYKDGIDDDNNIIVKGRTTVEALKAGITKKEDTAIRVYRAGSAQPLNDSDYVQSGDMVVAAAKNGSEMERSYSYYTIDMIKYEAINTMADVYDDDDVISASSKVTNYTETDTYSVTMYAAQYKSGELIKLWTLDPVTVTPGASETLSCGFEGISERKDTSIKIIITDDKFTPLCESSEMYYSAE